MTFAGYLALPNRAADDNQAGPSSTLALSTSSAAANYDRCREVETEGVNV